MTRNISPILWLLASFVILASSYSIVNPLFEAPDEVWHYELVRWLAEGKGLPEPADVGHAPWQQEGAQPPLYYGLGALLTAPVPSDNAATAIRYNPHANVGNAAALANKNVLAHGPWEAWPWQGVALAAHLLRFFSVLLSTLTVFFTWRIARLLLPTSAEFAWLATALVALNPQFLFISASITNDTLVTCCATVGLWWLLRMLQQHWHAVTLPTPRSLLGLGLILGAAALSKVSGLALSGLAFLVLLLLALRHSLPATRHSSLATLLRLTTLVALPAAALSLWWYWRNWRLWGDPLAIALLTAVLPGRDQPLTWHETWTLLPGVWRSFWGVFGWFNVSMDSWLYTAYSTFCLVALAGLLFGLRRLWRTIGALAFWLLLLWIGAVTLMLLRWAQINYPQGRLLFPAISALAVLLAYGFLNWLPGRLRTVANASLTALLLLPALLAPWRWIAPAYRAPAPLAADTVLEQPLDLTWGDALALHGYAISKERVVPGEPWTVTLYWRALRPLAENYSIFVHLLDANGVIQAQNDSFPAGGSWPTSALPVSVLIPDVHMLQIPLAIPAFSSLHVEIGVYDYQSGARLTSQAGDHPLLASLAVDERRAADGTPVAINFNDQIELLDYRVERTQVSPGESLTVELTWRALQSLSQEYVVFVHLLLPPDAVWAQIDEAPLQGEQPTSTWQRDQIIHDHHSLTLPADLPAGVYRIEIGLYNRQTLDRLKVNLEDAGIPIGSVRVP